MLKLNFVSEQIFRLWNFLVFVGKTALTAKIGVDTHLGRGRPQAGARIEGVPSCPVVQSVRFSAHSTALITAAQSLPSEHAEMRGNTMSRAIECSSSCPSARSAPPIQSRCAWADIYAFPSILQLKDVVCLKKI